MVAIAGMGGCVIKMATIEIYPKTPKPDWVKVGAKCYCLGEAQDVFVIAMVGDKAALLNTENGKYCHGWEPYTKIYQDEAELKRRRKLK